MANSTALYLGILMPVWALRMVMVMIMIIMYAVSGALVIVRGAQASDLLYFGLQDNSREGALGILMTMVGLTLWTFIFDIAATILYCCRHLGLIMFLIFSIVQSALMTGAFALTVVGYQHSQKGGILALTTIPWLLYVSLAIYAIVMLVREKMGKGKKNLGSYEKTPSEVFPNGQLPSTFSTSAAHPVPDSHRASHEAYV